MKWNINIQNLGLGGLCPAYYKETYSSYGNKNQSSSMSNIDCTNAGYILQGPGLASLTAGTQVAAVTTLIKGATDYAVSANLAFGIGGAKLYSFTSTAVTNAGAFPHTIDKATVTAEDGEDVCLYQGALYYSYNHSGSAGDIGKYDLATTFDDDWGSIVPSGYSALMGGVPHQMIVGGNDVMYFTNGRYIGSFDGTTLMPLALDLPAGCVIQSIAWMNDRVWVSVNKTSLTGANKNSSSIFIWDGTTNSWETEINLMGTAGGLHVKNGVLFVFYQDITSTGGYKLAYVNNGGLTDVANFSGGLPAFYQITDYKDFIIWNSLGLIYAFGSGDKDLPVRLFQLADGGYATIGCVVCPFGTPMIASNETTSYKLAQFSGLDVVSLWKSLTFDITGDDQISKINNVRFNIETMASGARVDWKLLDNQGITIYSDIISYAKNGTKTSLYYPLNGKVADNFRIELDYAAGSVTNPVKIKGIKINGIN